MCYWGRSRDREDLDLNQTWSPPPFLLPKTIKSLRKTQKSPIFSNFVCLCDKAEAKWLLESQDQSLKLFWSLSILLQASAQKSMKLQLIFIPNGNGKVREFWCIDTKNKDIRFPIWYDMISDTKIHKRIFWKRVHRLMTISLPAAFVASWNETLGSF